MANTFKIILKEKLDSLRSMSYQEIDELLSYQDQDVQCNDWRFKVAVWKDVYESGWIRIIVQVRKCFFLGFSLMTADGFYVNKEGQIKNIPGSELMEFS